MSALDYAAIMRAVREALAVTGSTHKEHPMKIRELAAVTGHPYAHVQAAIRWAAYQLDEPGAAPVVTSSAGVWLGTTDDLGDSSRAMRARAAAVLCRAEAESLRVEARGQISPERRAEIQSRLNNLLSTAEPSIEASAAAPRLLPADRNPITTTPDTWGDKSTRPALSPIHEGRPAAKRRKPWTASAWRGYQVGRASGEHTQPDFASYCELTATVRELRKDGLVAVQEPPPFPLAMWLSKSSVEQKGLVAAARHALRQADEELGGGLIRHLETKSRGGLSL